MRYLDDALKALVVVGVAWMVYTHHGAQLGVTRVGVGGMPWEHVACVVVTLAAVISIARNAMWLVGALACTAVVAYAAFMFGMFMVGGPHRSQQIGDRAVALFDALLPLSPSSA